MASEPGKEPAGTTNRVAELQVSAHLMTLETGLFCVFQAPGSPQPDPVTALPGVRITPAPGIAGRPEAVTVSTFREDGWLNGTAALVRVTDGSAQILVTIYQVKGADAAPRLQVLRLSGEAAVPDAAAAVAAESVVPQPEATRQIMAHVQRTGDVGGNSGDWIGSKGSGLWIEGFGFAPPDGTSIPELEYQAVLGRNWLSPWVEAGKYCGSRGMALPLLGLKIRLKGTSAKNFDCTYSATFVDGSAVGPVSAGETCEAESLAALEAFQVVIQARGAQPRDAQPRDAQPRDARSGAARPVVARKIVPPPAAAKPEPGKGRSPLAKSPIRPRG
ncbi:hypothetical protein [Rhodopila globiformis]|uniref:Uncharacterized protein n=1 Tax=Rhodopila globiformis TaxID=1071 RepID=A0A2S6N0X3_RHOGL|nr:hypothetical protein [Rhodopila globiformis]PPQ28277.1 hypothetical protein CCS01_24515 [Rhodopila globiformis]